MHFLPKNILKSFQAKLKAVIVFNCWVCCLIGNANLDLKMMDVTNCLFPPFNSLTSGCKRVKVFQQSSWKFDVYYAIQTSYWPEKRPFSTLHKHTRVRRDKKGKEEWKNVSFISTWLRLYLYFHSSQINILESTPLSSKLV